MSAPHPVSRRRIPPVLLTAMLAWSLPSTAVTARGADALVRASLSGEDRVWVGQPLTLVVELLAPGYFASAASFDLPDPEGALLMPPAGHPVVDNETIDGTEYSVQRHELTAWPMRPGNQSLPALAVRFAFKRNPLDRDSVPAAITTAPIPFTVSTPPGAEDLGTVISARRLRLEDTWSPEPGTDDIPAGTALTRTITFTAPDVPGMLFPPFPAGDIDGLGIYTKHELDDRQNRGVLTGVRRDTITYLCRRPGRFSIPPVTFTWFDLDTGGLRTEALPGYTLNVAANPAMTHTAVAPTDRETWRTIAGALISVALLLLTIGAARDERARRYLMRMVAPFRPVPLEPLNPTDRQTRQTASTERLRVSRS